ncbi:DUF2255 family protein [Arthrobacter oryzae]|uniref:DUF2255 family protein n=1 Tax=Arthrobacter oryzae TaxID=409290 RepID=UPI002866F1E7|nr:DUF2255 family protein [Arthrobacter oryzae]MDR6509118.1 hypothetical protein [Arthrobacter oryzae]
MTSWTPEEQRSIGSTDDFYISPFRADRTTLGTSTWIWSEVVDCAVYVRAYNGHTSRWNGSALSQHAGRITAGGVGRDVSFVPIDEASLNDRIDEAYRASMPETLTCPQWSPTGSAPPPCAWPPER